MKKPSYNTQPEWRNHVTLATYISFLKRLTVDSWRFDGLPFDDNYIYRRVNNILNTNFMYGLPCGLWKADEGVYVVGKVTGNNEMTWYGGYTQFQCTTPITTISRPLDSVALLTPSLSPWTDTDFVPLWGIIQHFAMMLYQADAAINVNLLGQNTPAIVVAPKGQELTWANIYEQVAGHKPVVYAREDAMQYANRDDIRQVAYQQPAPFVSNQIEQVKSMLISDFLFMLGINNRTQAKAAQVSEMEIMQDSPTLMILRNSYEQARQDFCDQCKSKFGLNVTCEMQDLPVGNYTLVDGDVNNDNDHLPGGDNFEHSDSANSDNSE